MKQQKKSNKHKYCSLCNRFKPVKEFSKCFTNQYQRYCKKCRSEYSKQRREDINKRGREYYKKYHTPSHEAVARVLFRRTKIYKTVRENSCCTTCGTIKDLCIHHIDEDYKNNDIGNLQVMCRSCHSKHHKTK